jgi:signal peptidase I
MSLAQKQKSLWKNENFQTVIAIILIVGIVGGIFFGSRLVLNTEYPLLTVESGSMCVPYDGLCDGWSHPFEKTLHVGDIIVVQGVNTSTLNVGDIIVFHRPGSTSELIVHRIIEKVDVNGTIYFKTKGDGNSANDPWDTPNGVPQSSVVGKVIGRVPWFGNITLFMKGNSWGIPVIVLIIALVIIVEFVMPFAKKRKPTFEQNPKDKPA